MTSTAKVSVAIGRAELEWAKTLARREGKNLRDLDASGHGKLSHHGCS
jgi:hypothetical protein